MAGIYRDGAYYAVITIPDSKVVNAIYPRAFGDRLRPGPKALFEIPPPIIAPAQLSTVCSPDGERFVFAPVRSLYESNRR